MLGQIGTSTLGKECLVNSANRIDGADPKEVPIEDLTAIDRLEKTEKTARQIVSRLVCPVEGCSSQCFIAETDEAIAFVTKSAGEMILPVNCFEGNSFQS